MWPVYSLILVPRKDQVGGEKGKQQARDNAVIGTREGIERGKPGG